MDFVSINPAAGQRQKAASCSSVGAYPLNACIQKAQPLSAAGAVRTTRRRSRPAHICRARSVEEGRQGRRYYSSRSLLTTDRLALSSSRVAPRRDATNSFWLASTPRMQMCAQCVRSNNTPNRRDGCAPAQRVARDDRRFPSEKPPREIRSGGIIKKFGQTVEARPRTIAWGLVGAGPKLDHQSRGGGGSRKTG